MACVGSGSSGLGLSLSLSHCVIFLGGHFTLTVASLQLGVKMGTDE